jgi:hypothetical protein
MSNGATETISDEEKQERVYRVLKRGSEDGQKLLNWLADQEADCTGAITTMAWAAAWIINCAPSEEHGHKIMETLMRSMCIYSNFFEDMSQEDRQAGGLRH